MAAARLSGLTQHKMRRRLRERMGRTDTYRIVLAKPYRDLRTEWAFEVIRIYNFNISHGQRRPYPNEALFCHSRSDSAGPAHGSEDARRRRASRSVPTVRPKRRHTHKG